jgi:hypothetical protein
MKFSRIKAGYMKKHSKFAGLPYVYRGMISCAECGCMITPEKKKNKYVYYRCTESYGKHKADWIREEALTEQFARMYKSLQIPPDVVQQIIATLMKSHRDKIQFHRNVLHIYNTEY